MSVNQSAESTSSSLQRSGLSITVGDTKSIVLALQALQSKIRSLEQDRDYHQDQYELSLQAHERYKLDMERQMEQERAAHRKRESDLLDLLRKAREERAELESALSGNKEDLGGFRKELEDMIASEKELATQRESKLNSEVNRLREDIKEEQTRRAALIVTVDKLREEREAALATNEQLRVAMDDLLTRYEALQQHRNTAAMQPPASTTPHASPQLRRQHTSHGPVQRRPSSSARGVSASSRQPTNARGAGSARTGTAARPRAAVSPAALHHTYEDPTCSSILRDVRVVPDEAPPCVYPSVNSSMQQGEDGGRCPPSHRHGTAGGSGHYASSPARRGVSANSGRGRATPALVRSPSSQRRTPPSRRGQGETAAHRGLHFSSALGAAAVDEVERQLQQELDELQRQYEDTVNRGASEEVPHEVLAAALHRVSSLVGQKKEQIKLLHEARVELEMAAGGAALPSGGPGPRSGQVGDDRATRRAMLVNELRSLLANASS